MWHVKQNSRTWWDFPNNLAQGCTHTHTNIGTDTDDTEPRMGSNSQWLHETELVWDELGRRLWAPLPEDSTDAQWDAGSGWIREGLETASRDATPKGNPWVLPSTWENQMSMDRSMTGGGEGPERPGTIMRAEHALRGFWHWPSEHELLPSSTPRHPISDVTAVYTALPNLAQWELPDSSRGKEKSRNSALKAEWKQQEASWGKGSQLHKARVEFFNTAHS